MFITTSKGDGEVDAYLLTVYRDARPTTVLRRRFSSSPQRTTVFSRTRTVSGIDRPLTVCELGDKQFKRT